MLWALSSQVSSRLWLAGSCWSPGKPGLLLSVGYWLVSLKAGSFQSFEKFPLQLIPTWVWSANKNHFVKNLVSNTYVRNQAQASVLSVEGRLTYALSTGILSLNANLVQCLPACFHPVSSLSFGGLTYVLVCGWKYVSEGLSDLHSILLCKWECLVLLLKQQGGD